MNDHYKPRPIDPSGMELPPELEALTEALAKNAHDVWARERMSQGWKWGRERNDQLREHPCLVPYEELQESEKELDRSAVRQTLKAVLAYGFEIQPPHARDDDRIGEWTGRWLGGGTEGADYRFLAESIFRAGEALITHDVACEGLRKAPGDLRLRQLKGLSLVRCGALSKAEEVARALVLEGRRDEETLGLAARVRKEKWMRSGSRDPALVLDAAVAYREAYQVTGGYWTGINAATFLTLAGEREEAESIARRVQEDCLERLAAAADETERYWLMATLGEALLNLNQPAQAMQWYFKAGEGQRRRWGDFAATRRQARSLCEFLELDSGWLAQALPTPTVVAFTGQRIDEPGRRTPGFRAEDQAAVGELIRGRLEGLDARVGYASAANGGDILFLEALLQRESSGRAVEIRIVLPSEPEIFRRESVDIEGTDWGRRFDRLLDRATDVQVASSQPLAGQEIYYQYAGSLVLGQAAIRARQLDSRLAPMALWNQRPGGGRGATAHVVTAWREAGFSVDVLSPGSNRPSPETTHQPRQHDEAAAGQEESALRPEIVAMLFADVVGFSQLTDREMPLFHDRFLGLVGRLVEELAEPPLTRNTWGDGLFLVFSSVETAGLFALDLIDRMKSTDWKKHGLARDLDLRVGLHAGPAFACVDPVTRQTNHIGSHVSRAARIEPIAPPGEVYASAPFAAIAAAQGIDTLVSRYVGQTALAKKYGTFATYHVLRAT